MSTAGSVETLAADAPGPELPEVATEPLLAPDRFARLRRWGVVLSGVGAVAGVLGAIAVVFVALHVSALQGIAAAEAAEVVEYQPAPGPSAPAESGTGDSGSGSGDDTDAPAREAESGLPSTLRRVDPEWARRTASATGIPVRALLAYASANLTVAAEQPGCGIGWNTLAAIGAIESAHGSHGGAVLGEAGYPDPAIRGVALNGDGVAAIRDTDDGAWDGDTRWDRAVGPMQFIPSTWARWGADGNGDGAADPNQIDDAALAAARYLCASGAMTSTAGWRAAVFSYNHSDSYVDDVAVTANRYAAASRR
ncbi:MAG: lytic murein transglycosylase [Propionibacteriaceae bacterium]|nr:lytic murein transglycosylase [Propionibacteriaceae bacterium]